MEIKRNPAAVCGKTIIQGDKIGTPAVHKREMPVFGIPENFNHFGNIINSPFGAPHFSRFVHFLFSLVPVPLFNRCDG